VLIFPGVCSDRYACIRFVAYMRNWVFLFALFMLEVVGLHHSARKSFEGNLSPSLKKIKESMETKLAHLRAMAAPPASSTTTPRPDDGVDIAAREGSENVFSGIWKYFKALI